MSPTHGRTISGLFKAQKILLSSLIQCQASLSCQYQPQKVLIPSETVVTLKPLQNTVSVHVEGSTIRQESGTLTMKGEYWMSSQHGTISIPGQTIEARRYVNQAPLLMQLQQRMPLAQ